MTRLRIATRKSPLALWQANYVAQQLIAHNAGLEVDLVETTTSGDRILHAPLASAGGKGLFMKELEVSLVQGRADLAVHSMKDVVVSLSAEFSLSAICKRDNPLDALVSNDYDSLDQLPPGARVGTCSLRRQCQLRHAYPHLNVLNLRGNVNSRLRKLDNGEFEAIVLAASGLERLALSERIRQCIPATISLPAVGQGAIGVEIRSDDNIVNELTFPLNHLSSRQCVEAERAMNRELEGGCQVPIAAFAQIHDDQMCLQGLVGSVDGKNIMRTSVQGPPERSLELGQQAADELIKLGAHDVLREVYHPG